MTTAAPGYTTTEFWLSLATNVLALITILHPGFQTPPGLAQALAALAASITTIGYSFSRAAVKSAVANNASPTAPTVVAPSTDQAAAAQLRALANQLDPTP